MGRKVAEIGHLRVMASSSDHSNGKTGVRFSVARFLGRFRTGFGPIFDSLLFLALRRECSAVDCIVDCK